MPNAEKRYIFAPTYGDENRLGSYVLLEIYPNMVVIALDAQRRAIDYNASPILEGYFSDGQVVTPELGGECVFTSLPDELEDWFADHEEFDSEKPLLFPVELHPVLDQLKEQHWSDSDLRWDCRPCRFIADKDDIRLQIADKHEPDYYVWTSSLHQILEALAADMDVLGFSITYPV